LGALPPSVVMDLTAVLPRILTHSGCLYYSNLKLKSQASLGDEPHASCLLPEGNLH